MTIINMRHERGKTNKLEVKTIREVNMTSRTSDSGWRRCGWTPITVTTQSPIKGGRGGGGGSDEIVQMSWF